MLWIAPGIDTGDVRLITSYGAAPTDPHYPVVTCLCVIVDEEVPVTGVYRARCEVHCETYMHDDVDGSVLDQIASNVREQLQRKDEAILSSRISETTIHGGMLSSSRQIMDDNVRRIEMGIDLIWSPTD